MAIKSFRHKGLELFFTSGDTRKINPSHARKIENRLDRLDASTSPKDMNLPGFRLHQLKPTIQSRWAVDVSGAWRITFEFHGVDAIVVDYEQYH